jgi:hypothetical protein
MTTPPDFVNATALDASSLNAVGLWLVTPTVTSSGGTAASVSGGAVILGNGNTSVTITAFSADFDNYLMTLHGALAASANPGLYIQFGAATTGYYSVTPYYAYDASGDGTVKRNNGSELVGGFVGANHFASNTYIFAPHDTQRTAVTGNYAGDLYNGTFSGMLANNNSYTSVKLSLPSNSFVSGKVRIYGIRD